MAVVVVDDSTMISRSSPVDSIPIAVKRVYSDRPTHTRIFSRFCTDAAVIVHETSFVPRCRSIDPNANRAIQSAVQRLLVGRRSIIAVNFTQIIQ